MDSENAAVGSRGGKRVDGQTGRHVALRAGPGLLVTPPSHGMLSSVASWTATDQNWEGLEFNHRGHGGAAVGQWAMAVRDGHRAVAGQEAEVEDLQTRVRGDDADARRVCQESS